MHAILAGLALLAAPQEQSYDLIWHPAAGQHLAYDLGVDGFIVGQEFHFQSEVHIKVKKVEANGDYTLGTQFLNGKTRFGGQEEKIEDDPEEIQRYNKRGDLIDKVQNESSDEPDIVGELLGQATDLIPPDKPVKLLGGWTKAIPANKKLHLPAAAVSYRLAAINPGSLVVTYSYAQKTGVKPLTAKGVMVLDPKDASLISVKSDLENLQFDEDAPPAKAKLEMYRRKG